MVNLPGNCKERLIEMRSRKGLNQRMLSKELEKNGFGYFDVSTISRAENGKTARINTELIEALAKYYNVTADYLLGITNIPDKKNYELSELGLSYESAISLIKRETNPDGLNLLMRCGEFSMLCDMAASYFTAEKNEINDDIREMFPGLPDLFEDAECFGYDLSESDKRKLKADLSILREPERLQKETILRQFELVVEEMAENMRKKTDPERLSHESNELKLLIRKEVFKRQRQIGKQVLSEEDKAKITAGITAIRMGMCKEEKELFEQLYLMMMQNRSKKKDEKERQSKIQTHEGWRTLHPVQGTAR